jgi:hypothetical protein
MNKGELRNEILENCPEEFHDELKEYIDKLESLVDEIVCELNIDSISDIGNIETAYNLADDLADGLY